MAQIKLNLNFNDLKEILVKDDKVIPEIANSIVQEFTRRYLKSIANEIIQPIIDDFKEEINVQILHEFNQYLKKDNWTSRITLSDRLVIRIREEVREQIKNELFITILDELKKVDLSQEIQSAVNIGIERLTKDEIVKVRGIIAKEVANSVITQLQDKIKGDEIKGDEVC